MREFLGHLYAALREVVRPAPYEDDAPQSTAEATAARTAWVASHKHPAECAGGCRCKGG